MEAGHPWGCPAFAVLFDGEFGVIGLGFGLPIDSKGKGGIALTGELLADAVLRILSARLPLMLSAEQRIARKR